MQQLKHGLVHVPGAGAIRCGGPASGKDRGNLAYASLSGFLGIIFCGTRNQDFSGSTTKILVPLTINPITTTTTTTTLLIVNLYILIR